MAVIDCANDEDFQKALSKANSNGQAIILDFYADWCGPCKIIAPYFSELSMTYPTMAFIKVNVDKCKTTAESYSIKAMPTFLVLVGGQRVDKMEGASNDALLTMVKKWEKSSSGKCDIPGQMDLISFIELGQVECLNSCDDTPVRPFLEDNKAVLRSDCDEQIIITVPFMQPVKLHSIHIKGGGSKAPKLVRIFANLPKTLDFDDALGIEPVQMVEFGEPATADDGETVALRFVKFQNVRNVQLFFENNQEGGDVTELRDLKLFGSPVAAVNMDNFKRVGGKAGEVGH